MMNWQYKGLDKETTTTVQRLLQRLKVFNGQSCIFEFQKGEAPSVVRKGTCFSITYSEEKVTLFRGLLNSALLLEYSMEEIFEESQFETVGIMLDLSRAGVMKVEQIKSYLDEMALMGLNTLYLYMEDMFCLEGYPYFGHLRGRYSKEELKAINTHAVELGIEAVPCIQTLGHFEQYNKWTESADVKDTSTVLLVGSENTYALIDRMVQTVSECFSTKKIHVGMDEAWDLGFGKYIKTKGYREATKIFCDHIVEVKKITDRYGLEPAIWSDMYFRLASHTGEYYEENTKIPSYVKEQLPDNMAITYWDYYHEDEKTYQEMIKKHRQLTEKIIFAGGIWCWNGFVPDMKHTFSTTNTALTVCKKTGIRHIMGTVWGDDGCETDYRFSLIGALLYGEHAYRKTVDSDRLEALTQLLYQGSLQDFILLSELVKSKESSWLTIKQIVYSDPLVNMMRQEMESTVLLKKFEEREAYYHRVCRQRGAFQKHFLFIYEICKLAREKIEFTLDLNEGYRNKEEQRLKKALEILSLLEESYRNLKGLHYELWNELNKPFGFEILDTRYGGVLGRIETAKHRIVQYLNGEIEKMDELEEKTLPYAGKHFISGFYVGIQSPYIIRGY